MVIGAVDDKADLRLDRTAGKDANRAGNGARILLVDDDRDLLRLLSMRLAAAGYRVAAVATAEEALVKLAEWATVAQATGARPLFAIDEFDAGLAAGWIEALFVLLPVAETVLLTTASEPARYARRVDHILEIRGGRAFTRLHAVNA